MQLSELTRQKFTISLNSVTHDPSLTDSLKSVFQSLQHYLSHHDFAIELLQSQLHAKASSQQMKVALAGKLGLKQFVGYVGKVEKVVERVEGMVDGSEIQKRIREVIRSEMGDLRWNEQLHRFEKDIQLLNEQIIGLKKQCKTIPIKCQKETQLLISSLKESIQSYIANSQKYSPSLLNQMKQMQQEFNQSQSVMKQFLQQWQSFGRSRLRQISQSELNIKENEFAKKSFKKQNDRNLKEVLSIEMKEFVTFRELRDVIGNLQQDINQSIQSCLSKPSQSNQSNIKLLWQWQSSDEFLSFTPCTDPSASPTNSLELPHSGRVYKLLLGYFSPNQSSGALSILLNGSQIEQIEWVEEEGGKNVARTIMMYVYVMKGGVIEVKASGHGQLQGFMEIQTF